jgi:hypothetical protein
MRVQLPESEDSTFLDPHVQLEEVVGLHDALGHDHRADLDKKIRHLIMREILMLQVSLFAVEVTLLKVFIVRKLLNILRILSNILYIYSKPGENAAT